MKVTDEGLALIKASEGFRAMAYRDAVGVWTVGYGHTSRAGAPQVTPGLRVSEAEASDILHRDVDQFATGVARLVRVSLSDQQFSALVSFAYNVGLGAFAGSGVLNAVNAADFAAVPRKLNAWVKAGGRVLPGLVKRRAAEAALFMSGAEVAEHARPVQPVNAKTPAKSKTLWSAGVVALASLMQALRLPAPIALALIAVAAIAAAVIAYERFRKLKEEQA
ncbi:MAG: lysozyme [Hyphomicrobiales bacterium]